MQLQVHSILSPQVTHDEKTPCEEQQVKRASMESKEHAIYAKVVKCFLSLTPSLDSEFIY